MIVSGGMPGWQIILIAAAALLLAATLAVTLHRVRAARQRATVTRYDTKLWMRDLMEGAAYLPK